MALFAWPLCRRGFHKAAFAEENPPEAFAKKNPPNSSIRQEDSE